MSQAGIVSTSIGPSPPSVATSYVTDSGTAIPALNVLNVLGGSGIQTSANPNLSNNLIITVIGSGFTWNVVTSATNPNSLVKENGYIPKGAGVVTFLLPATAAVGDTFNIAGYGNLWTLTQNAGQRIILGNNTTTVGVGGSLSASMISDTIELICVTANTEFKVIDVTGNLIVV